MIKIKVVLLPKKKWPIKKPKKKLNMNTLGMTFAICLVPATAFLLWLYTPWGKKWLKTLD